MQISKIKEKNAWPHRATVPPSGTVKRSRIHRAQTSCVIHHHQWGIFGRHRFHSLTPLSRLPEDQFPSLKARPTCYVGSNTVARVWAQIGFQINQDRPTNVPLRSAVPRANAPPQLAQRDRLPTSLNRSAPLQPEETGLRSSPAPLRTWTWQRKEIPRRGSEIFAVKTPGGAHTISGRLTGGSRGQRAGLEPYRPRSLRPRLPVLRLAPSRPAPRGEVLRPGHCAHTTHTGAGTLPVAAASTQPAEPPAAPMKMAPTLPSRRDKPTYSLSAHALSGHNPQPRRRGSACAHAPRRLRL